MDIKDQLIDDTYTSLIFLKVIADKLDDINDLLVDDMDTDRLAMIYYQVERDLEPLTVLVNECIAKLSKAQDTIDKI